MDQGIKTIIGTGEMKSLKQIIEKGVHKFIVVIHLSNGYTTELLSSEIDWNCPYINLNMKEGEVLHEFTVPVSSSIREELETSMAKSMQPNLNPINPNADVLQPNKFKWTGANTTLMLTIYLENKDSIGANAKFKTQMHLFKFISEKMLEEHKYQLNHTQVKNRFDKLVDLYKKINSLNNLTGHNAETCEYYDLLEKILGEKRNIKPNCVTGTSGTQVLRPIKPRLKPIDSTPTRADEEKVDDPTSIENEESPSQEALKSTRKRKTTAGIVKHLSDQVQEIKSCAEENMKKKDNRHQELMQMFKDDANAASEHRKAVLLMKGEDLEIKRKKNELLQKLIEKM